MQEQNNSYEAMSPLEKALYQAEMQAQKNQQQLLEQQADLEETIESLYEQIRASQEEIEGLKAEEKLEREISDSVAEWVEQLISDGVPQGEIIWLGDENEAVGKRVLEILSSIGRDEYLGTDMAGDDAEPRYRGAKLVSSKITIGDRVFYVTQAMRGVTIFGVEFSE